MNITLKTIATKQLHTYTAEIYDNGSLIFMITGDAESPEDFKLRYNELIKDQLGDIELNYEI